MLHPELHNLGDQSQRQHLIQRKLHRPLGAFVPRQLVLKSHNPRRARVKTNMLFEPRKMHQIAVQPESRYLVADSLSRAGCRFLDGLAQLLEQGFDFRRESGYLSVYGIEGLVDFFHDK